VTTKEVAAPAAPIMSQAAMTYDGTRNFLGEDVQAYIGQELYLPCRHLGLRKFGYEGFIKNYTKDDISNSNIYACCDGINSKYDKLAGRYFTVLEVLVHPKAADNPALYGAKYFLKLKAKDSDEIVYYKYDSHFEHIFPFIVVAYFNKQKELQQGKIYITRGRNWFQEYVPMTEINTGNPVEFSPGISWKCIDVTVEGTFCNLALILENENKEQIALPVRNASMEYWVFLKERAEEYLAQYGEDIWEAVLQGKVKPGMSAEACQLSWGKPKEVNETIGQGSVQEQWVYDDNYLYMENGVLKTIQRRVDSE
jgi:hypothetical protein